MFKTAREATGMSREMAACKLHIGSRTLNNYEHGYTIVPPEVALRMADVYKAPTLTAKYCSDYCPIGQIYAHNAPDHHNLCQSVLGLLEEHNDVSKMRDSLISIASDGIIDESEIPAFENIMGELLALEQRIEEIKIQAADYISIPAMMQKRKMTALAAR